MNLDSTFSQNLMWTMDEANLSPRELATRLGVNIRTVRHMLSGDGRITGKTRRAVADAGLPLPDGNEGRVTALWLSEYHKASPYPGTDQTRTGWLSATGQSFWRTIWRRFFPA